MSVFNNKLTSLFILVSFSDYVSFNIIIATVLQTNKEYLEKSLKENEQNLRELVLSKQQQR